MFWSVSLSFTDKGLLLYSFRYLDDGLDPVFTDFLFGRRLVTPITFSLIGASDTPAILRA